MGMQSGPRYSNRLSFIRLGSELSLVWRWAVQRHLSSCSRNRAKGPARTMTNFDVARQNMVDSQIRTNKVTDEGIVEALRSVPRHLFVPQSKRAIAYRDDPIEVMNGRCLPSPMVAARLYQLAEVGAADLVLVVGATTGYGASILGRIASAVVALEEDPDLCAAAKELEAGENSEASGDNIFLAEGPLCDGWQKQAPYDAIIVEGAIESIPETLLDQLAPNGRLVCVVRPAGTPGRAVKLTKSSGGVAKTEAFDAMLPLLPGFASEQEFAL